MLTKQTIKSLKYWQVLLTDLLAAPLRCALSCSPPSPRSLVLPTPSEEIQSFSTTLSQPPLVQSGCKIRVNGVWRDPRYLQSTFPGILACPLLHLAHHLLHQVRLLVQLPSLPLFHLGFHWPPPLKQYAHCIRDCLQRSPGCLSLLSFSGAVKNSTKETCTIIWHYSEFFLYEKLSVPYSALTRVTITISMNRFRIFSSSPTSSSSSTHSSSRSWAGWSEKNTFRSLSNIGQYQVWDDY